MIEPLPKALRIKERVETLCVEMIDMGIRYGEAMDQFEKCFISEIMQRHEGSISHAADELGLHRNTLAKKIERYHLGKRARQT